MVAFLMMGVLALLGFLCISHTIPGIVQSHPVPTPRKRRDAAQRLGSWGSSAARPQHKAGVELLVGKS